MADDVDVKELALIYPDLTPRELAAYRAYAQLHQPSVAASKNGEFYRLFLAGKSMDEIVTLNPGFSLGQLVRCRIEGKWDENRQIYLIDLMKNISRQTITTQLETIKYLSDLLAANHKLYGQKIAKFLQTGNTDELTGVPIGSFKQYREVVELLKVVTEEEKDAKTPTVKVSVSSESGSKPRVVEGEGRVVPNVLLELANKLKK